MSSRKTVVIIGGGPGGFSTFKELGKKNFKNVDVILISMTDFYYFNIASPRAITDDTIISKILIPYDNIINGYKKFIHGKVVKFSLNDLVYRPIVNNIEQAEENLSFDYLVLALGSSYNQPFGANVYTKTDQANHLQELNSKIKNSNKILVLGGGPVGVEMAGEIATDYPDKKVTIVTKSDRLVGSMSRAFSSKALNIVRQKNIEVFFNDSVDLTNCENFRLQKVTTVNGKELEFDAFIECAGSKPATKLVKEYFPDWLDSDGRIKVTKELRVRNTENIFAVGDCCDTDELKLFFLAEKHGEVAAYNIDHLIKSSTRLNYYSPGPQIMGMSIGRDNGVMQVSCITLSGLIPTMVKSKSLFIPKTRKSLGY